MFKRALINDLKRDEGFSARPYLCPAGKLTIGYGRNLDDVGISENEATYLLIESLKRCEKYLEKLSFWNRLNEVRQDVLMNMCYNLGFRSLSSFRRMFMALEVADYEKASKEMLDSKWRDQVGDRAKRLSLMMKYGKRM